MSGLKPDAVVIVATIRALKTHGGGPPVKPGVPLDPAYTGENLDLVEKGCENLLAHIDIVRRSGARPVVCLNRFKTDTDAEIAMVRRIAEANGARAVTSDHWLKGGEGAIELAEAVIETCNEKAEFRFLYDLQMPLRQRIDLIAREIYGADGVTYTDGAMEKAKRLEAESLGTSMGTCMAKTQQSLSHDPNLKGRPRGWTLPISDILVYKGAGFVVPVAGAIKLMPGTGSDPAFRRINVDVTTGKVHGLF
jgi:formate--tetrahydrofolate ligase